MERSFAFTKTGSTVVFKNNYSNIFSIKVRYTNRSGNLLVITHKINRRFSKRNAILFQLLCERVWGGNFAHFLLWILVFHQNNRYESMYIETCGSN